MMEKSEIYKKTVSSESSLPQNLILMTFYCYFSISRLFSSPYGKGILTESRLIFGISSKRSNDIPFSFILRLASSKILS